MTQDESSPPEKGRAGKSRPRKSQADRIADRIRGQFLAEVLGVNDLCTDKKQKTAMRGVIMGATDRLFYRLKREWGGDNRNGPRRDTRESRDARPED